MSSKKKKKPAKRAGQASSQRPDWNAGLNDGKRDPMSKDHMNYYLEVPSLMHDALEPLKALDAAIARHPGSHATPEIMSRRLHEALNDPSATPEVRAAAERIRSTIDNLTAPPETLLDHVYRLSQSTSTPIQSWFENRDGRRLWVVDMDAVDKAEGRPKDPIDDFGESVPADSEPSIQDLIEESSLGSPGAKAVRETVSVEEAEEMVRRSKLLRLSDTGEHENFDPQPNLEAGK